MSFPTVIIYYQAKNITITNFQVLINQASLAISDIKSVSSKVKPISMAFGIALVIAGLLSFGLILTDSNNGCFGILGFILIAYGAFHLALGRTSNLLFETSPGEMKILEVKGKIQSSKVVEAANKAIAEERTALNLDLFNERKAVVEKLFAGIINELEDFAKSKWGGKYSIYYTNGVFYSAEKDIFEWLIRSHIGKSQPRKDADEVYLFYRFELAFKGKTATPNRYKLYCTDGIFDIKTDEFSEKALKVGLIKFRMDRINDKRGNPAFKPRGYFDEKFGRIQVAHFDTTMPKEREVVAAQVNPYVVKALEEFASKMWTGNFMIMYDKNKDDATSLMGRITWIVRSQEITPVKEDGYDESWFEYPYYTVSLYFDGEKPDYFTIFYKGGSENTDGFEEPISEAALRKMLNQVIYDIRQPDIERTTADFENHRIAEREIKRLR